MQNIPEDIYSFLATKIQSLHQCMLGADWHIVHKPAMCHYGREG